MCSDAGPTHQAAPGLNKQKPPACRGPFAAACYYLIGPSG